MKLHTLSLMGKLQLPHIYHGVETYTQVVPIKTMFCDTLIFIPSSSDTTADVCMSKILQV